MTVEGNEIRLTIPAESNARIAATYVYELPAGDFDVQVDMTGYTVDGSGDLDISLFVNDYHFNNYVEIYFSYDDDAADDFRMFRVVDGGSWTHVASDYGVGNYTNCRLRIKRVGTKFYTYYTISVASNNWVYLGSYTHANAALIDRVSLRLEEYGAGGTVDFDNLKFNKSQCPDGSQWSTTTTSSTTCSTCSTLSTEPPV